MANLFAKKPLDFGVKPLEQPVPVYRPQEPGSIAAAYKAAEENGTWKPTVQPQTVKAMPAVNPNSDTSGMDALLSMYTSPEDELKMKRASMNNQRILAVADALRHIGNIYNTTNYAPAQQFNNPVLEARQRYQQDKALRDAANARYMTYQQAKAAQDQKQRQWEATFNYNLAKDAADYELKKQQADANVARQNALAELDKARQEGVISENEYKRIRNEWYPKQQEAALEKTKAQTQSAKTTAWNSTRWTNERIRKSQEGGGGGGGSKSFGDPLETPNGKIRPISRNYPDQIRQMYDYAKENNMIQSESGNDALSRIQARFRNTKEPTDAQKRQVVMGLLRNNPAMANYAHEMFGWEYVNGGTTSGRGTMPGVQVSGNDNSRGTMPGVQ